MAHQGKTVLVTGGAAGLGRAIAEHFLSLGSNVVICDINKAFLADYNEKIVNSNADRTLAVETDITSEPALDDLFEQIEKKFGHLDYAINSAGIVDYFHPAGSISRSEWDRVIAVNLTAPTFVTQRAVASMLKAEVKGSIVNIASIAAFKGFAAGKSDERLLWFTVN
jgi:NAD(P)-dependent dehydrogenase (short-subunit alcohol dehydrogenase family)